MLQQSDYGRLYAFLFVDAFARAWSFLLLIVAHHCLTRTPSSKSLYPERNFLSAERGFTQVTRVDPSPPSAYGEYLSVTFFQPPICLIRSHVIWYM